MAAPPLPDCVAVVTGASSGIGAEIARALAGRGLGRVVLVARRRERLEALAEELGDSARVFIADLTRSAEVEALIETHPRVDLLVNNAGIGSSGRFDKVASTDGDSLSALVDLNCRALVRLTAAWVPGMVERGGGWVLNVGSIAGMFPTPTSATYGASKAFVNQFTESLRIELRDTGVAAHLLAPGPVATEFLADVEEHRQRYGAFFVPARRVAEEGLDYLFADRPRHVPGWLVRLSALVARSTPLALFRPVAGFAMRRRGGDRR